MTDAGASSALLLSERIRVALADEITAGMLAPGLSLDEQQIGDRFGASRTPVREAIRQLAAGAGRNAAPARRGRIGLHAQRIIDMFEMSAEIEAMCVRLATYRMNPIERSRLRASRGLRGDGRGGRYRRL
jgi:DNA-binding GntR family transcriptional regulator